MNKILKGMNNLLSEYGYNEAVIKEDRISLKCKGFEMYVYPGFENDTYTINTINDTKLNIWNNNKSEFVVYSILEEIIYS